MDHGDGASSIPVGQGQWAGRDLFRLVLLALLIGQMLVYYDTATKAIPHINVYLLVNLVLILLTLIPWERLTRPVWLLLWPVGALMRWDWGDARDEERCLLGDEPGRLFSPARHESIHACADVGLRASSECGELPDLHLFPR